MSDQLQALRLACNFVLLGLVPETFSASQVAEPAKVISLAGQFGLGAAGGSFCPSFSPDGKFVVFASQANNLVTNDDLGLNLDVFVRGVDTGRITLVSVNTNGFGGANADANYASISSNGQFVAFASAAGNLVGNDTNSTSDVFVRDLVSGLTTLVSVDTNGVAPAGASQRTSSHPLISANGRWVFFESTVPSLVVVADSWSTKDVFVRDMQSNATQLVSVRLSGNAGSNRNDQAELDSITPDGRFAAFVCNGTNFAPTATNSYFEAYVRDLLAGTTLWASSNVATFFSGNPYRCLNAVLSDDGRFLAFKATTGFGPPADTALLFRHDLITGTTTLVVSNSLAGTWPGISADGHFVAWEDGTNVFVWDAQAATNILVSLNRDGTGPANGASKTPTMTPDVRFVTFLSGATDLVPDATSGNFQVYVRDLVAGITHLVSVNQRGLPSNADHQFIEPAISADGRQVVFESGDEGLVPNDSNRSSDVFLRDLTSESTVLLSERIPSLPWLTGLQHCAVAGGNCLSADGRFLVFSSFDNDLVAGDTNGWPDIFVHDLFTGSNQMVGLWTNPVVNPILSADGRHLLFTKPASFFSSPSDGEIYRRDLLHGTTTLVNQRWDGAGPGNQSARACGISQDGRFVLFTSAASDLLNLGGNSRTHVFLRDMILGTNLLVSANLAGGYANGSSYYPTHSPDGCWVAFASDASDLVTNFMVPSSKVLYLRDLVHGRTLPVSHRGVSGSSYPVSPPFVFSADSGSLAFAASAGGTDGLALFDLTAQTSVFIDAWGCKPALSSNAGVVAYQTRWATGSPWPTNQVLIWSRATGVSNLASISTNRGPSGSLQNGSCAPLLTADGRFVVFASRASNLVADDRNSLTDLFVRDLLTSNTVAVSASIRTGATGNGSTGPWAIVPAGNPLQEPYQLGTDGRTVIFQSWASDLIAGDYNDKCDLFFLRLGTGDSDGDGMDDAWEMAFFGTLARDGKGDFDGDAATDLDEFLAGTDPTNTGSVLRAMTLTSLGGSSTTVLWPAVAGRNYQVLYRDDIVGGSWIELAGPIVVDGATARIVDNTTTGHSRRFYRVVVLP